MVELFLEGFLVKNLSCDFCVVESCDFLCCGMFAVLPLCPVGWSVVGWVRFLADVFSVPVCPLSNLPSTASPASQEPEPADA